MEQLYYTSTRGQGVRVTSPEAILKGIAEDGGLFVPMEMPSLPMELQDLVKLEYRELALAIMKCLLPDFTTEELETCINKAYDEKFDTPEIAPLEKKAGVHFLELFHGPTLAFKDMALTVLPHLLKTAAEKLKIDKEIVILTATSGDTGKAALEGFADVAGTRIIVFFPEDGVSQVQKKQMVSQEGKNTHVIGIKGNFDDAQSGVKAIFTDPTLKEKMAAKDYLFSSANSINIGRLVPQVVYYFSAYSKLCTQGEIKPGDKINFSVPTGNFGNILAGYYAKEMGLPINKLICASNKNKVLFDFFASGSYDKNRKFHVTMSPSMDILISSNLERLLYEIVGNNSDKVKILMDNLITEGNYIITSSIKDKLVDFTGGYATEEETAIAIKEVFSQTGYTMDPHTAVAYSVYQKYANESLDTTPTVVVSTASPYKFIVDVMKSIDIKYHSIDDFKLIKEMHQLTGVKIPSPIKDLEQKPVLHKTVCEKEDIKAQVEKFLGL